MPISVRPDSFTVEIKNTIHDLLSTGPLSDIVRPASSSSSGAALSSLLSGPERLVRAHMTGERYMRSTSTGDIQGSVDGQHWYTLVKSTPECHITMKTGTPDGSAMEMSFVGRMEQVKVDTQQAQAQANAQEKKQKEKKEMPTWQNPPGFITTILSATGTQTIGYERATVEREAQEKRAHPTYPFYGATRVETLTPQEMSAFLGQVKDVVPLPVSGQEHLPLSSVFSPGRTSGALREEPQPQQKQQQAYTHTFQPGGGTIRGQSFDMIAVDEAASLFPSSFFSTSIFSEQAPVAETVGAVRKEEVTYDLRSNPYWKETARKDDETVSPSSVFSSKTRAKAPQRHEKSVLRG